MITANHITKSFSGHTALKDVSVQIPSNTIFGLLGPNGAGKTTFIRIINRIIGPDNGTIHLNNEPLNVSHTERIGYLPEERGLYKKMKVGEQALYLARLKGLKRKDALKRLKFWFEKFEIEEWWNKKVEELSKGMQQKVQFIITVVHQPELLIFDEPFTGFDPINTRLIRNEILDMKKNGATIILSTHNMESVEELCDHIALINRAEVILEGGVKEIRNRFKPDVFEIIFEGNLVSFTSALWTGFELLEHNTEDNLIKARVRSLNNSSANDLLGSVLPAVKIHSFSEVLPRMSDIFIKVVKDCS
ncbi:MAG: ATP-binding cassette domain-containing protein [Bacteroidetes bacterium]|nr:ATP-binding cassette domain-containing protein [Bacteroidota bacterium]